MRTLSLVALAWMVGWTGGDGGPPKAAVADRGAAPVTIFGTVTVDGTGAPLPAVRVSLRNTAIGTTTDANGRYSLLVPDSLVGSTVEVVATAAGFTETTATVEVVLREAPLRVDLTMPAAARRDSIAATPIAAERARRTLARALELPAGITIPPPGARPAHPPVPRPDWNREGYASITDNPFLAVGPNPQSTFSIDVDRASYANVRRFLREGRLPPAGAVRIEELVNYFPYGDPAPGADEPPFRISTEVAPAPWQPAHHLVRIALRAREVDVSDIPPSNLVFLMDVSGSMRSPDKLPLLKGAFSLLVEQLRPEDRVAIVVYAGAAGLVLESTPGDRKAEILEAIDRLEAGGSTAGGAGLELAYRVAAEHHAEGGNNRVILATDGDFNVGASSDAAMVELIERKREQGTFLTVLGFGTGNLQDAKMEQIADHGNGNFAYIDGLHEARKVLVQEMGGTLLTVAKDVKIQVEFNPERVRGYRLIGYENRLLAAEDFQDDTKDAGELGAGHTVTALYEVVPAGVAGTVEIRDLPDLRYQRTEPKTEANDTDELLYVKLRWKEPDASESREIHHPVEADAVRSADRRSEDFRFAAAVAAWGMLLRDSEHCGDWSFEEVERLATSAIGEDPDGYRAQFVALVKESARIAARGEREGVPTPKATPSSIVPSRSQGGL